MNITQSNVISSRYILMRFRSLIKYEQFSNLLSSLIENIGVEETNFSEYHA